MQLDVIQNALIATALATKKAAWIWCHERLVDGSYEKGLTQSAGAQCAGTRKEVMKPYRRREMAKRAVAEKGLSIDVTSPTFYLRQDVDWCTDHELA